MAVDDQTCRDLEIFESDSEGPSLFDLFSQTRSTGGARVLRKRMSAPFSDASRIRSVQRSLRFLVDHPQVFARLPTDVVLTSVEEYLRAGLPVVLSENTLEIFVGALETRFGDGRSYGRIARGVVRTCRFLGAMQGAAAVADEVHPEEEIGALLGEARDLLAGLTRAEVPMEERWDMSAWRILRLDRLFRVREVARLRRLIELAYQIDALGAMAQAVRDFGLVFPEILDGPLEIAGDGIRSLFVHQPVLNPIQLDPARPLLFLTGPNMAGKTTYLRACGTCVYLAQLGMGVPAARLRIAPADCLFTSLNVVDNLRGGVSYFRAEALRMKAIAEAVTDGRRVVALIDEPFKGTNVRDALDASRAIMAEFASWGTSLFMIASHLIELAPELDALGNVACSHFEASEADGRLRFDYLLKGGVSSQRLGMRVLAEEGIFDLFEKRRAPGLGSAPPAP